jgi:hypothetical protein
MPARSIASSAGAIIIPATVKTIGAVATVRASRRETSA